jgi:hypothetical protein
MNGNDEDVPRKMAMNTTTQELGIGIRMDLANDGSTECGHHDW